MSSVVAHDTLWLSVDEARKLLEARQSGVNELESSFDLGLTKVKVLLDSEGVKLPDGRRVSWSVIEEIAGHFRTGRLSNKCFILRGEEVVPIQSYSGYTNRFYSLLATDGAPTLVAGGFPMHRIKGTDPLKDTAEKIKAIAPVIGKVLDTAMGLGYTAIMASKTADEVITVEIDPEVVEIAKLNPWSRELFENPKIKVIVGDSFEVIREFPDQYFDRVIHDPPIVSLAGDLYSLDFYKQLYRVIRPRGRLFHYIGNPEHKMGHRVTRGVVIRLQEAGFKKVVPRPQAFGVVAYK